LTRELDAGLSWEAQTSEFRRTIPSLYPAVRGFPPSPPRAVEWKRLASRAGMADLAQKRIARPFRSIDLP
jgi:hypothetical protein